MKIHSRTAALAAGLASLVAIALLRAPAGDEAHVATAGLTPTSFLHVQEAGQEPAAETGSQEVPPGQGETAAEATQYAGEQDQATRPAQWQAIDDHVNATRGPEQPIPFNHRFHVTDLQIDCQYCHVGTEKSVSGIVPSLEICLGCHRVAGTGLPPIEELRAYGERDEPIPWKWVNKLPEFVQFSHQPHLRNEIECAECHGPVEEMDRVYQWAPLTMGWCLECHRRPPAETDLATDHILALTNPPPEPPEGPQPGSFYPYSIDTDYGATRAPTDCAACHY